jgi:hypothetical protein
MAHGNIDQRENLYDVQLQGNSALHIAVSRQRSIQALTERPPVPPSNCNLCTLMVEWTTQTTHARTRVLDSELGRRDKRTLMCSSLNLIQALTRTSTAFTPMSPFFLSPSPRSVVCLSADSSSSEVASAVEGLTLLRNVSCLTNK